MSIRVTVAGVDRNTYNAAGVSVKQVYNERSRATFALAAGFAPTELQEVIVYENDGVTPKFGGIIHEIKAGRFGGEGPLVYEVECVDWWAYLDWCLVNGGYVGPAINISSSAAPNVVNFSTNHNFSTGQTVLFRDHPGFSGYVALTVTVTSPTQVTVPISIPGSGTAVGTARRAQNVSLKQVLSDLVVYYLSAYGITLDAAQDVGPTGTHEGLQWNFKFASDVVRDLTSLTTLGTGIGWLARISPTKVLRMVNPDLSVTTAPFSLASNNERAYNITWSKTAGEYANRVVLKCGSDKTAEVTQVITLTATHASLGYLDVFAASTPTGGVSCTLNGVAKTIGGIGSDFIWTWDGGADGRGRVTVGSILPVPSIGDVFAITFTAQYPFYIDKNTGTSPVVTRYYEFPDITDPVAGDVMATGLLAKSSNIPKIIEFETLVHGFAPGQIISIVISDLSLNTNGFIEEVEALGQEGRWQYKVKVNTGAVSRSSLDTFRSFSASGGGGTSTYSGGVNTVTVTGAMQIPLGGSNHQPQTPTSGTYVDVTDATLFYAKVDMTGATVHVAGRSRASGATFTFRLYDVTAGASVGASSGLSGTTEQVSTITVNLIAGHRYKLQVTSNVTGESIYGIGTLTSP